MKYLYLFLLLGLAGCALTPKTPVATVGIAELQQQHRYLSALKMLNATSRNAPDYTQRRDALLTAARDYQSKLIHELSELLQQQQFVQAQQQLEAAQAELPISRELDQFSAQLYTARDRYQQRYLDEILQLRSTTLLKEKPLYQALQKAATEPAQQQLVVRQQADVEYFTAQLSQAGTRALAQNDYAKAAQYLGLANQLSPSTELAQLLKRAELGLAANKQKQQIARSNEREQRYRELTAAFLQYLQQRDYATARAQLEQIKALAIHSDELEAAQTQLDGAIGSFVAQQIDAGNRLYSEGHIEDALQHWRQAAALTPTPELIERIDKAQRFIDRLEQLRTKQ